jgi:Na+-driven multidrug efflux pump
MAFLTSEEDFATAGKTPLIAPAIRFAASILVGCWPAWCYRSSPWPFSADWAVTRSTCAIYTPIGFLVLAVTEGLVVAAQVSAGIATRSGRRDTLRLLPTFLALGGGALIPTAGVFAAASSAIMSALEVDPADRGEVLTFVVAVCLTTVVSLVPLAGGAVLRGMGRTVASSVLSVGFTVLSIAAMTVLGVWTDLGMLAVPASTLIAGVLAGAAALMLLRGHTAASSWFRRDAAAELWAFGAPVAVTFLILSSVNFGYLRVLREANTADIAGFNLGQGANSFFMVVAIAVGSGAAIVANLQPGEVRRPMGAGGLCRGPPMDVDGWGGGGIERDL